MKSYALFFLGVFSIASIIGLLTGLSASPVVSVLIPLIFGLITAGGAIYIARGAETAGTTTPSDRQERALVLGVQLIAFSLGFILGLWPGSAAKLHPEKVWLLEARVKPAYGDLKFEDLRVLAAVIELDQKMKASGLEREGRQAIIKSIYDAIQKRALDGNGVIAASDLEGVKAILGVPATSSTTSPLYIPVARSYEDARKGSPFEGFIEPRVPG